jgi:hypothetical protein
MHVVTNAAAPRCAETTILSQNIIHFYCGLPSHAGISSLLVCSQARTVLASKIVVINIQAM